MSAAAGESGKSKRTGRRGEALPRTAIVLAGGGALGAYEAGVVYYILTALPRELGHTPRFDIFAGTSVGALNVSFLASHADDPLRAAQRLWAYWDSLAFGSILRFTRKELSTFMRLVMGGTGQTTGGRRPIPRPPGPRPDPDAPPKLHPPVAGLFDTSPLHEQMRRLIPWQRLQRNLQRDVVRGLALCATEVCTGRSVIFYQTGPCCQFKVGRDPMKSARRVNFGVHHAMASAAIPFLFPAVQINKVCYTDGALRQNTPLNPALRLGADRVLVVSLTQEPTTACRLARQGCRQNPFPGALFLLGKTVKILLSQTLDYELKRVEIYNTLIRGGTEIYGEDFLPNLNKIMGDVRNATYRPVRTCHVRPTRDLDRMALEAWQKAPGELDLPGVAGKALMRILASPSFVESELLGMLMFTPTYLHSLLDLGYQDARAHHDELLSFFGG